MMPDWGDLEDSARRFLPSQELEGDRCYIGVRSHEIAPNEELQRHNLCWMIGHGVSHVDSLSS